MATTKSATRQSIAPHQRMCSAKAARLRHRLDARGPAVQSPASVTQHVMKVTS